METTRARAVLARTPALDAGRLCELLDAAGGEPERAVGARVTQRVQLTAASQQFLASPDEATIEEDLAWLASSGTRILLASDADYPPLLRESAGAPAALYVQGSVAAL
ncbi:MAG: DNA-protecting protein DprA, partial [Gammaproteobacteria bacterium]|nr:DNA-protecting protein DprA [Gammaproteobacteria bacterium]